MTDDLASLLPEVVELARRAGRRILEVYGTEFEVTRKADTSPVTAADLASQELIVAGLADLTPGVAVIGEEGGKADASLLAAPLGSRLLWLVDPLDGTKEFVKRNGEFSVNIALVSGADPVLGVVHAPVGDLSYGGLSPEHPGQAPPSGHAAAGAWRYRGAERLGSLASAAPRRGEPVRVMVSRSHSNAPTTAFVEALQRRYGEVTPVPRGSAVKSCLVAAGDAHYYPRLGPTMWWDTAAAQAVLRAAGGELITSDGGPLAYDGTDLENEPFVAVFSPSAYLPQF